MVFSSIIFLFWFLPFVLILYYLAPGKMKNFVMMAMSLLFYTWGEEIMVILVIISTIVDFFCGLIIESGRRKLGITISVMTNLGLLGFFKYFNFAFENFNLVLNFFGVENTFLTHVPYIALPIGISFYSFQTLSYTIDVYKGEVKANRNIIDFAAYVTMFPQLVAGPIVRYADINDQLNNKDISVNNFALGTERFIIGLAKKVLIANTFATIADDVFSQNIQELPTLFAWIGIIAYSFQIYYDFSGYSDMAIGLGKMFGFDFLENFNYPYISKSIREFWRRWHISLSSWFRDYVYIPLGGDRKGKYRTYVNLMIVFFLTGLWHGASWNFIVWGFLHGFFIVGERLGWGKRLQLLPSFVQHCYTLLIVVTGWVFFRAENMGDAFLYLQKMFWFSEGNLALYSYLDFFHANIRTLFFLLIAIIFAMPLYLTIYKFLESQKLVFVRLFFFLVLFAISIVYLGADSYNPFIYFRF